MLARDVLVLVVAHRAHKRAKGTNAMFTVTIKGEPVYTDTKPNCRIWLQLHGHATEPSYLRAQHIEIRKAR
jgi:hypothetical protein